MEDEFGITSELTYTKKDDGILIIDHTQTRKILEGRGLASMLVKHSVEFARKNNYMIDPLCPFAEVQFDLNKDFRDVLVK